MGTLANSEDPDEMSHKAAFHQGLQGLLRQNRSAEKEIQYFGTVDPSLYIQWAFLNSLYITLWKFHCSKLISTTPNNNIMLGLKLKVVIGI